MTLDECIAYLENVLAEKKPRSRKARQIIKYLNELKKSREAIAEICWQNASVIQCRQCPVQNYDLCPNDKERGEDGRYNNVSR